MTTRWDLTPEEDGLALLLAFHGEIRRALDELSALAGAPSRDAEWRRRAGALLAFLRGPFVHHDLDEEVLLSPLLLAHRWPEEVEQLIDGMSRSHEGMEAQIEPLAAALARAAAGVDVDGGELRAGAARLRAYVEMSLAGEERLFARARDALSGDERRRLAEEMCRLRRARRGGGAG